MNVVQVVHNGEILATVRHANQFWTRFIGLMGRRKPLGDGGLWIDPCSSVHMAFMKQNIDIVALRQEKSGFTVTKVVRSAHPWGWISPFRHTDSVLELEPGRAKSLAPGAHVELRKVGQFDRLASSGVCSKHRHQI